MEVLDGYINVRVTTLMDLLSEMEKRTHFPMVESREKNLRRNPALHMIDSLLSFMSGIDDHGKYWMSIPSFIFSDKAKREARSTINIRSGHWIVNKRVREKMIAAEEL